MEGWKRQRRGQREEGTQTLVLQFTFHSYTIFSLLLHTHTVTILVLIETKQNNSSGVAWRVLIIGLHRTV